MSRRASGPSAIVLALTLLAGCAAEPADPGPSPPTELQVRGPTIVGFYPASDPPGADADDATRRAFDKAISRTVKCLQSAGLEPRVEVVEQPWIQVADGKRKFPVYPPFENAIGVYLMRPSMPPRYVDAVQGTDALLTTLPRTAAQYFGAAECERGS